MPSELEKIRNENGREKAERNDNAGISILEMTTTNNDDGKSDI